MNNSLALARTHLGPAPADPFGYTALDLRNDEWRTILTALKRAYVSASGLGNDAEHHWTNNLHRRITEAIENPVVEGKDSESFPELLQLLGIFGFLDDFVKDLAPIGERL